MFWQRVLIAVGVIVVALAGREARRLAHRAARPRARARSTRYRVLRRALFAAIVFVGVLSALLVIPQVRALAGGVLASSAVIGLVIGFASQRTIGNFVAGLLIAITQPLRLGDEVEVAGHARASSRRSASPTRGSARRDNDRLVVPNEKLASDTIRNSTIRSRETLAEVTVRGPAGADLREVLESLEA